MATYKQLRLKKRPQASESLSLANYELHTLQKPEHLKEGEILAKVLYLSCDPTLRIWATDAPQYMPPVQLGEVMRAGGIAVVEKSNNPKYAVGDRVLGLLGWTEYIVGNPALNEWSKDPTGGHAPVEVLLGPCGLTGWTAYFGLLDVGKVKAGDNVLVSGAAGATGSVVVQLAKISGCRVVAIAGGSEKCGWVKNVCGADEVIDYKSEDLHKRVRELAGRGYDVYFDNVGGASLEAALDNIALGARIVLCGAISGYNEIGNKQAGPSNYIQLLMKRATMSGFIVLDFKAQIPECVGRLSAWVQQGKIKFETDVQEAPLEKATEVLNRLYSGQNKGKQLHKLVH